MPYDLVVFDWDGTLVDSEHHIVSSIAYAAERTGLPVLAHDRVKGIIGLGMREALEALYPDIDAAGVEAMRQHYSTAFFERETGKEQLFDGVIPVLEALKESGVRLAVATGKSRRGLERALDSTGLRQYFELTRCADETHSKPHPLMLEQIADKTKVPIASSVMVGDTEYDMKMAHSIGMDSIGVSYGVHEIDRLSVFKPLTIIDHMSELLPHVSV